MRHFPYNSHLKEYSQINRKIPTKSEGLIWNMLLKGNRTGYRFLRQKPIGGYILDFYCPKLKLAIEIDGESHESKGDYDKKEIKHYMYYESKPSDIVTRM